MATHFLSSSTGQSSLYKNLINIDSIIPKKPDVQAINNTTINIIDEFSRNNCTFHKVSLSNSTTEYFVEIGNVFPLPNTQPFADYKCDNLKSNSTYTFLSDWYSIDENVVIFDEKELKYKLVLLTPYLSLNDFDQQEYANTFGIRAVLDYYNIFYTDELLEKLKNSYKFCVVEDYNVPYTPKKRIKLLVSIKKKYINALIQQQKIETFLTTDKVVYFDTYKLNDILSYVHVMFTRYQKDIYLANAKIARLDLHEESKKIIEFFNKLKNFLYENNISLFETKQERIELVLDSCNKIKYIAYRNNGSCFKPKIGLNIFLQDSVINNSRTINFVEKLQEIYNIEFCSYTWDKFVNKYVFPKPKVEISNRQKDSTQLDEIVKMYNNIINTYNAFSIKSETTYKEMLSKNSVNTLIETKYNQYKGVFIQEPVPLEEIQKSFLDNYTKNSSSKNAGMLEVTEQDKEEQKKFINSSINNIYNFLTVYGLLCNLTPTAIKCLTKLFTLGEVEPKISLDIVKSYSYEEIKTKILFSLTEEEKREVFSSLLDKTNLSKREYVALLKDLNNYPRSRIPELYNNSEDELKELLITSIIN